MSFSSTTSLLVQKLCQAFLFLHFILFSFPHNALEVFIGFI